MDSVVCGDFGGQSSVIRLKSMSINSMPSSDQNALTHHRRTNHILKSILHLI